MTESFIYMQVGFIVTCLCQSMGIALAIPTSLACSVRTRTLGQSRRLAFKVDNAVIVSLCVLLDRY